MVRSREAAWATAQTQTSNDPGTCQLVTRNWFDAPSAGDRDRDGDADAVDGWVSEPTSARHPGDRNPPLGVPLAFSGGRRGFGHRMISGGPYHKGRSTDMRDGVYVSGATGYASIEDIERQMGLNYLGWSETITGIPIPYKKPGTNTPVKPIHRNTKVSKAHRLVERALIRLEARGMGHTARAKALRRALKHLPEF